MPKDDTVKRLSLLLPEDMHAQIKRLADKERRSLHAQILVLLEKALESEADDVAG